MWERIILCEWIFIASGWRVIRVLLLSPVRSFVVKLMWSGAVIRVVRRLGTVEWTDFW